MPSKKAVQKTVESYLNSCAILPPKPLYNNYELLRALEVVADKDSGVEFFPMNMGIDEDFLRANGIMSEEIKNDMIRTYKGIIAKPNINKEWYSTHLEGATEKAFSGSGVVKALQYIIAKLTCECGASSKSSYDLSIKELKQTSIYETYIVEKFLIKCVPTFCFYCSTIRTAFQRLETRPATFENIEYGFAVVTSFATGEIHVKGTDGKNGHLGGNVGVPKAEVAADVAGDIITDFAYDGTGVIGARVYYVHVKKKPDGTLKVEKVSLVKSKKDKILKTTLSHIFTKSFRKMVPTGSSLREEVQEVQGAQEVLVTSGTTPTNTDLVQLRKDLKQGINKESSLLSVESGDDSTGTQEVLLSPEDSKVYDIDESNDNVQGSALFAEDMDNNSNNMLYTSSLDEFKTISKAIKENGTYSLQGKAVNGIKPVIHCTMPDSLPIMYRPSLSGRTESGRTPNWVHREKGDLNILVRVRGTSGNSDIVTIHNNTDWHVREFFKFVKKQKTKRIKELEVQGFFRLDPDEAAGEDLEDDVKRRVKSGAIVMMGRQLLALKREAVMAAVEKDGMALQYASNEMKADKEVVRAAVKQNADALQYASEELQGDEEMRLYAANKMKSQKS